VRAFADTVTPWEEGTPLESWITPVEIERTGKKDFAWRNDVSRKLAQLLTSRGMPTLLFVLHNRHHAFSIANRFEADLPDRPEATQEEQDLCTIAAYELGTSSVVQSLVDDKGVAVHTAAMLNCERRISEIAFDSSRALLLVATGTLSQGLNLSASAVVICGTEMPDYDDDSGGDREEVLRRSLNQVLNAAGRAARANWTCRGISIVVPDSLKALADIDRNSPKSRFFSAIRVLAMKDAWLSVDSSIRKRLEDVVARTADEAPTANERYLLSRLPADPEGLAATVRNSLGLSELQQDDAEADRIINRLDEVRVQAVLQGYCGWVLRAASLAGMDYVLAGDLKAHVESCLHKPGFVPPQDTYVGWSGFLIEWLKNLPASATWDILQKHIKVWRHSSRTDGDPDLVRILKTVNYPQSASPDSLARLNPIWANLRDTVRAWLEDKTLLEIGRILTRRDPAEGRKGRRSDSRYHLPRAIKWSQTVVERLSRFAGLLLAVQNQWAESDQGSMPDWLADSIALYTLPLGLRFGVQNPSALAWHRHVIQERRAANLLQSLVPLEAEAITELQEAWEYTRKARNVFIEGLFGDDELPVAPALRRTIAAM